MHDIFQQEVFRRITIPFSEQTLWEGMVSQTFLSLLEITLVFCAITAAALAWQRISDHIDRQRRRNNED